MGKQELVELEGLLISDVGESYCVAVDGKEVNLPKSLMAIEVEDGDNITFTIPEWLAYDRELI